MPDLTPVQRKFILHWGEMGTKWGINRTVAQVQALLLVSDRPLHAEDIAATLSVARSSVSTAIRELQSWGIVETVHALGDRRDYFESPEDIWEMFRVIVEERKRREIDPTVTMLRECVAECGASGREGAHTEARVTELLSFFETMTAWHHEIASMPRGLLMKFLKMGSRVKKLLGASERARPA